jgi:hypothetical protein
MLPFDTSCALAERNTGSHAFCLPSTEMLIHSLSTVQCIVLHGVVGAVFLMQLSVSVSITHRYCVTNTYVQFNMYHTLSNCKATCSLAYCQFQPIVPWDADPIPMDQLLFSLALHILSSSS